MEVNGQHHAPEPLTPGSTEEEAGLAPEPVWTISIKIFAPTGTEPWTVQPVA